MLTRSWRVKVLDQFLPIDTNRSPGCKVGMDQVVLGRFKVRRIVKHFRHFDEGGRTPGVVVQWVGSI
jgi:hypothetical protein